MKRKTPPFLALAAGLVLVAAPDGHAASATSLKEAYRDHFLIGAALNPSHFRETDPARNGILTANFNSITPENVMKWQPIHPRPDEYNFGPADRFVAFGEEHDMFIVGHTLVWHSQTPSWVFEDEDGSVWMGTVNEALKRVNPATGKMTGFPPAGGGNGASTDRVLDILPVGHDAFWLASYYGIVRFDRRRGSWRLWSHREAPGMAGEGYATSLLPAAGGGVWMGTAGGGLKRFDPETGEFTHHLFEFNGEADASHNTITGLARGPDGRVLTLNHAGIDRFDPETKTFQALLTDVDAVVLDMVRHGDGTYWLATNLGLVQARLESTGLSVIRHLTTADGLPDNELLSVERGDSGRLWFTTSRELVRLDPVTGDMRVLDASNGLPNVAFTKLLHRAGSGLMYVGLINGLARFEPRSLEFPGYRPPVVLTDLRIMNRSVMPDGMSSERPVLALDHEDRMVTFRFAALDYASPGEISYQYRLQGFDENWIHAGNRREATYTNLPPGNFTFQVRSTNSYGEWQPTGLSVALEMAPPPWRTWWAYSLYALAAFLILAGAFLVYRRKVARDHQLARERDQRQWAEDLHDLTRSMAASLKSEEILSRYLDGLANAMRYEAGMVYLAPGGEAPMAVGRGYTNQHRPPHTRQLRRALTTVRASHQPVDMTLENGTTRQTLALPLLWRSEVLGVVLLERVKPFTPRERATALALGEQAGTALENARLFGEVEHLAHDAQAANRAKSDFLARMSHEIRTPMNGVLGMAELLMESRLTPEQHTYARAVKDSGDLLLALINDILDFSRIEAGKLDLANESFDLGRLLAEVVTLFGGRAVDKGLALTYEIDPDVPRDLRGDPQRLRQVLMNLVGNAFKFTEQGRVSIRVRCHSVDSRRVTLACDVDDTGIGISRDAQQELFQAFSQVESATGRRYGGTGLGLAICRELVEKMGGEIGVESEPGNGSRFYFTVQLETAEANDTVGQAARRIKGRRVLVACRDEVTRCGLVAMLGNLGVCTGEFTEETSVDAGDWDAVGGD
jgi:signal transduction histidine kinase/streptogramin lyase